MPPDRQTVTDTLAAIVARIDAILRPWGFVFVAESVRSSHSGPYASGHYQRDTTRIGLSCRATLDNVYYEQTFIKENLYSRETERFTIGHDTLMDALGHSHGCHLVCTHDNPIAIAARDGDDPVAALILDLEQIAEPVLRAPCSEFDEIARQGHRVYSVE